jgi:hypothetical protein
LIAGYLWLFFLWILIKPDIHKRPANEVGAAVYDLAKDAGPFWTGLGIGMAAWLVGSVSQALSPMLGHKAWPNLRPGVLVGLAYLIAAVNQALPVRHRNWALSILFILQHLRRAIAKPETDLVRRHERKPSGR